MSEQSFTSKLRAIFEERRGSHVSSYDPTELAAILTERQLFPQLHEIPELTNLLAMNSGVHTSLMPIPHVLPAVISKILSTQSANTILDPCAGVGSLLAIARQATSAKRCIGYNSSRSEGELGKTLFPEAEWFIGQALELLPHHENNLDVVISLLPFSVPTNKSIQLLDTAGNQIELKGDLGNLILAAAMARLSENGVGLFVVPPSFFYSTRSIIKHIPYLGFSLDAALFLPPGSFSPYTSIGSYLLVVKKGLKKRMFVGELTNDHHTNLQILENFSKGEQGDSVDLGCYVDALEFRGVDLLRAKDYFESASKHFGFPTFVLEDLATEINLGRLADGVCFPLASNAIFIPMIGRSEVVDSIEEFTLKAQNYAQVIIDPSKSYAKFVMQFLNSELGMKIREWAPSGIIPRLNKGSLKKLQVLMPDLETQQKMLEIDTRFSAEENILLGLQNDLTKLRRDLWKSPQAANMVSNSLEVFSERIAGVLKGQVSIGLDQWIETIPFPIASVLRAWQSTASDDFKAKYEHLLHFFEATAEFLGVILLSAFYGNEGLYDLHKVKLKESMAKQNLSFQRATFGTWKLVVEYLGKQTRSLLQENGKKFDDAKNDRSICETIFADQTLKLPRLLCSKEIIDVLQKTNSMRNNWTGHGGIVGQEEAQHRNEQLFGQVEKLRQAMSDVWDTSVVVNALNCKPRKGVFENEIAMLKGSNSEFLKESRTMSTWLDIDSLYIINGKQERALKLLPLISMKSSHGTAKDACYFFNKIEKDKVRFVSYHFSNRPELVEPNDEVFDTIKQLSE